jgi:hypothetical protein
MSRASKIISLLCFAGFIFLLGVPPEAETTSNPVAGLLFSCVILLWLALSFGVTVYGVSRFFAARGFRMRIGHFAAVVVSLPGIVYFIYSVCVDTY